MNSRIALKAPILIALKIFLSTRYMREANLEWEFELIKQDEKFAKEIEDQVANSEGQ